MKFSAFLASITSATFNTLAQGRDLIAQAVAQFQAIGALFASASLDADELLAGGPDSLKQKIEALNATAVDAAIAAKITELGTAHGITIAALKTEHAAVILATINEKQAEFLACFEAIGVKLDKYEVSAARAALHARAETLSHELLAARGMKPLPEQIKASDEQAETNPQSDEQLAAAYLAMKPGSPESIAFAEKHSEALWRNAGRK